MTDSDVIKALECLTGTPLKCRECPYSPRYQFPLCQQQVAKDTLDLINRQKEEIKRLQKDVNLVYIQFQDIQERQEEPHAEIDNLNKVYQSSQQLINALNKTYFLAKAEAYKEFAERLKKAFVLCDPMFNKYIDNLVKEMVSDYGK